jgi:sporulation protein YlmC with PRC-barrel domain
VLYRIEQLIGMSVWADDGEIGRVRDVYFDDTRWAVRHLICDTGRWLAGRKILISPLAVETLNWTQSEAHVRLTRQQVKDSPDIDSGQPVSRRHEAELYGYYGHPHYWGGPLLWGMSSYPVPSPATDAAVELKIEEHSGDDAESYLRSAQEVVGYHLETSTQPIGHLKDLLIDDETWAVRYIVIDTRNWWPGKHVVIPPQWITRLDWAARVVTVDVDRDTVRGAPEFDPGNGFARGTGADIYHHYPRPAYWQ